MALHLSQDEREELDRLLYIVEQNPWKLRALVAENIKLRQFLSSVRKYHRFQHSIVQHQMDELPRANDAGAWENLALDSLGESTG
jgi:hypothetical protein